MTLSAQLYWSFRSPYSYLATRRYVELSKQYDLAIDFRPVYPLAVRQPDFFERNHPNWLRYLFSDIMRLSQYLDIPLTPPQPDPIVQDMVTRKISDDQPYIFRLTRLGQLAAEAGQGLKFADLVSRHIWGGTENWDKGDHLAHAAAQCGLDLAEMDKAAVERAEELDKAIAQNQDALEQAGHWGVPTLVLNDEAFFGQDRIDLAQWRIEKLQGE